MIRRLSISLVLVLMAALAVAPAAVAQDKLEGAVDWAFNKCHPGAPSEEVPSWVGTVEFDGEVFDALAWSVGTGLPFGHMVDEHYFPFIETIAVYRDLDLVHDDECAVETLQGDLLVWGHAAGLVDTQTGEYSGIGVARDGVEKFDGLAGSPLSTGGTVVFDPETGAPLDAASYLIFG